MIPLYDGKKIDWETLSQNPTANLGLIFNKYPPGWSDKYKEQKDVWGLPDNAKKEFFEAIVKKSDNQSDHALQNACNRQRNLVETTLHGASLSMQTSWRFVSGLGASHPYETGFIWHPTLGAPYLPGSSVKGLLRAWGKEWQQEQQEQIDKLFGSENSAGSLIVFDALPEKYPQLELDILNPHYQEYYADPKNPPADYCDPVPVFFLTVAPGQTFLFSLATRPGAYEMKEDARKDVETGLELLKNALETIGAGGKTAVGYGLMQESKDSKKRREKQAQQKQAEQESQRQREHIEKELTAKGYTGLAAEIYKESEENAWATCQNRNDFYDAAQRWLPNIVQESNVEVREKCVEIFSNTLDGFYPGIIKKPDRPQGKKKLYYQNDRARALAKQLNDI
ncbi:MAG: type III-B CRISPR module RAMP protein Cmr6 [Desulfobulbus sp.]|nr:type III-B CRISPR module RAMP protein Cmr6 [Desulfobulbus sp.]